jgi:cell wall-associated NlpC family hydrolase
MRKILDRLSSLAGRKKGPAIVAAWDGLAFHGLSDSGGTARLAIMDGDKARLDDMRLRGATVRVVIVPPAMEWKMIETPDGSGPDADSAAFWSVFDGREAKGFDENSSIVVKTTAPGIYGQEPTCARVVSKNTLRDIERASNSLGWKVSGVHDMLSVLAAGCAEFSPSESGGRRAWFVIGDRRTMLLVGSERECAYAQRIDLGDAKLRGASESGDKSALREMTKVFVDAIEYVSTRLSAETPVEGFSFVCPAKSNEVWSALARGVSQMYPGISVESVPIECPGESMSVVTTLYGASSHALSAPDMWDKRPADPKKALRSLGASVGAGALSLALAAGFAHYAERELAEKTETEKVIAKAAASAPDPEKRREELKKEATTLESRIASAKARIAEASSPVPMADQGSTEIVEALDAVARFRAEGAGLDGVSARWSDSSEIPALSATGWAESRQGAVDAALSLAGIGYGRWGASEAGWNGSGWTFRIDPPSDAAGSAATGSSGSSTPPRSAPKTTSNPAKTAGDLASHGPGPARQRPSATK